MALRVRAAQAKERQDGPVDRSDVADDDVARGVVVVVAKAVPAALDGDDVVAAVVPEVLEQHVGAGVRVDAVRVGRVRLRG